MMKIRKLAYIVFSIAFILATVYFAAANDISIPGQSWPEDTSLVLNLSSHFPSDASNFAITSPPSNIDVQISQNARTLTFVPQPNFHGERNVQIIAVSANNSSVTYHSNNITLTVTAAYDRLSITSSPILTAEPNRQYQYQMSVSNPDSRNLAYGIVSGPSGMTVSSTGLVIWTPSSEGNYNVNLSVSDGSTTEYQGYAIKVALEDKLSIENIDVRIDGKSDKNVREGEVVGRKAVPGSRITIDVKVRNLFTRDEDVEIRDIEVEALISGIDDGEDFDESSDNFDLNANRPKTVSFSFDVPMLVEEDDYDVTIDANGRDENGRLHSAKTEFTISVDKETHHLSIRRAQISREVLSCERTANLEVEVINLGNEDEDRVKVEVLGPSFGFRTQDEDIELISGSDSDSVFRKNYLINAANLPEGTFDLQVKAYYDDTVLEDSKTATFSVEKCTRQVPSTGSQDQAQQQNQSSQQGRGVEIIYVTQPSSGSGSYAGPVTAEKSAGFGSDALIPALLIVAIIVILSLIIYIIKLSRD